MLDLAGDGGRPLLRAATLFELPVPEPVLEALAAEVGGASRGWSILGLLEPFEDLVEHRHSALAVIPLLGRRLQALVGSRGAQPWARSPCLALFRTWGGADDSRATRCHRPRARPG